MFGVMFGVMLGFGLILGLNFGLMFGLIFGLMFGFIFGFIFGLKFTYSDVNQNPLRFPIPSHNLHHLVDFIHVLDPRRHFHRR